MEQKPRKMNNAYTLGLAVFIKFCEYWAITKVGAEPELVAFAAFTAQRTVLFLWARKRKDPPVQPRSE